MKQLPSPDVFDRVCSLLQEAQHGLTLSQLAAAGAIARELEKEAADLRRLRDLCAKAGTTLPALDDHLSDRRRGGGGDQYSLFGGSGAGPAPVSPPAPHGSDPCARAAVPDRTRSHGRTAA